MFGAEAFMWSRSHGKVGDGRAVLILNLPDLARHARTMLARAGEVSH